MGGITVRDLLKNVYSSLQDRNSHETISLERQAVSEIADDTDWHRSRTGYMGYGSVDLFDFGKQWMMGRGERCGSYPARPYDSDILALEFPKAEPKNVQEEIEKKIGGSSYFTNSILFGYADGNIGVNKEGRFGGKMMSVIKPKVPEFIVQSPKYDDRFIEMSTLKPLNTKEMLYKPEFAGIITEAIEGVLKEESRGTSK